MDFNTEPTLEALDDYNNNEPIEKRRTIRLIVIGILVVGLAYSYVVVNSQMPEDYIGTPENPGIGIRL